jgi:hypothetical protein
VVETKLRVAFFKDGVYSTDLSELNTVELAVLKKQIEFEIDSRKSRKARSVQN